MDYADQWIETIEQLSHLYGWDNEHKLRIAQCRLAGRARMWATGRATSGCTWPQFKMEFEERFGSTTDMLYRRLATCAQRTDESARSFSDVFLDICRRLDIDVREDKGLLHSFMRGLQPDLYQLVFATRPTSLQHAIDYACYLDNYSHIGTEGA